MKCSSPHQNEQNKEKWPNPVILKNRDRKNPLFVIQGTSLFPHSRLSSHCEKKFPYSRLCRSWGNFSSLFLLSLSWRNTIVPFMTQRVFLFPLLAAARLVKEISRPHFLKWQDWAISQKYAMLFSFHNFIVNI